MTSLCKSGFFDTTLPYKLVDTAPIMVRVNTLAHRAPDSPSRQLIQELTRDLEQVRIHGEELKLVKAYESRTFYEKLDRIDREREEVHNTALNAAAAKRDQRRLQAEETLRLHLQAVEEERRRKEEAERRQEKIRQEKEEKERKEREEAARLEAERKAREAEKARQAEEAEKAKRAAEEKARVEREKAEQEKKKKADDESRRKADDEAKRKAAEDKERQAATKQGISGLNHRTPQEIQEHERYLKLHAHLKEFRSYMKAQTKSNALLKQHMGDMRRTIRKCVGQLVAEDKTANQKPVRNSAPRLLSR